MPDNTFPDRSTPTSIKPGFQTLPRLPKFTPEQMLEQSSQHLRAMQTRRSVRDFSSEPVPLEVIQNCIQVAGLAPNGANRQPWHFVIVQDANKKRAIREAAEAEEREFYQQRAPEEWLNALAPLGTDAEKPFLETAPYLIVIFSQSYGNSPTGEKVKHYYVQESVGIATGFLITALHLTGLATLTHTPSPMKFLNRILGRPESEKPYLILVVGYPAENAVVPIIAKKRATDLITIL